MRRVLIEVVIGATSCQRCDALVLNGERAAMVQLVATKARVEPWCLRCLFEEIKLCSELMLIG